MKENRYDVFDDEIWQRIANDAGLQAGKKAKLSLTSAAMAILLTLSFLTAVVCLRSHHRLAATHAASEESAEAVSASDTAYDALIAEADPEKVFAADEHFSHKSFTLYPDGKLTGKAVSLDGLMPEDASAQAVDVIRNYADPDDVRTDDKAAFSQPEASVIAAYNITITDGGEEYEPAEDRPIRVEITDPQISTEGITELWHIKDDGERELIVDYMIREGKLSFYAAGFSVYAIVAAPDPYVKPALDPVTSLDDLTGGRAGAGFYLYYIDAKNNNKYFTGTVNTNGVLIEAAATDNAAVWFLEQEAGNYRMYTLVGGQKVYIHNLSDNKIELSQTAYDGITITGAPTENTFYFKKADESKWLQHSGSGEGIRYLGDNNNTINSQLRLLFADNATPPDDCYGFGGKSYGLMHYTSGTVGNALMAGEDNNHLEMLSMVVRADTQRNTLFVAEDSDISLWTFHLVSDSMYKLSTVVNGVTRYLKVGERLTLTDEA